MATTERDIERLEYSIMEFKQTRDSYLRLAKNIDELILSKRKKIKKLLDKV